MSISKKVKDLYRKNLFTRAEIASDVSYFTSEDFAGLREIPYSFVTEKGNYYLYANGGAESIHPAESIKRMSKASAEAWLEANR